MIEIAVIRPGTPEVAICAGWRVAEFAGVLGSSVEAEWRTLEAFTADATEQIALIARHDGQPAGTCLLVPLEIEPMHPVTPWLAGFYVAPAHRRMGVGAALVRAIEEEARRRRHGWLYLYTDDAAGYYERLGWRTVDQVWWKGFDTFLMQRELKPEV